MTPSFIFALQYLRLHGMRFKELPRNDGDGKITWSWATANPTTESGSSAVMQTLQASSGSRHDFGLANVTTLRRRRQEQVDPQTCLERETDCPKDERKWIKRFGEKLFKQLCSTPISGLSKWDLRLALHLGFKKTYSEKSLFHKSIYGLKNATELEKKTMPEYFFPYFMHVLLDVRSGFHQLFLRSRDTCRTSKFESVLTLFARAISWPRLGRPLAATQIIKSALLIWHALLNEIRYLEFFSEERGHGNRKWTDIPALFRRINLDAETLNLIIEMSEDSREIGMGAAILSSTVEWSQDEAAKDGVNALLDGRHAKLLRKIESFDSSDCFSGFMLHPSICILVESFRSRLKQAAIERNIEDRMWWHRLYLGSGFVSLLLMIFVLIFAFRSFRLAYTLSAEHKQQAAEEKKSVALAGQILDFARFQPSFPRKPQAPSSFERLAPLQKFYSSPDRLVCHGCGTGSLFFTHVDLLTSFMEQCQTHGLQVWDLPDGTGNLGGMKSEEQEACKQSYNTTKRLIEVQQKKRWNDVQGLCDEVNRTGRLREMPVEVEKIKDRVERVCVAYQKGYLLKTKYFDPLILCIVSAMSSSKDPKKEAKANLAPLKGLGRCIEKLILRPSEIAHDIVRAQIEASDMEGVFFVLSWLVNEKSVAIHKLKNRFKDSKDGWADISILLSFDCFECKGMVAEIQIVHSMMMVVREQWGGHHAYAENRYPAELATLKKDNAQRLETMIQIPALPYRVRSLIQNRIDDVQRQFQGQNQFQQSAMQQPHHVQQPMQQPSGHWQWPATYNNQRYMPSTPWQQH